MCSLEDTEVSGGEQSMPVHNPLALMVLESLGFEADISRTKELTLSAERELAILQEQCDPQHLILEPAPQGARA